MSKHKDKSSKGEPSVRLLRVGENVRHAIADVLARGEVEHQDIGATPVSVTEVRVSPDLRNATVFVMPLGGDPGGKIVSALRSEAGHIRGLISPRLAQKYMPKLSFKMDESFDAASTVEGLLRDPHVAQDLHINEESDDEAAD